MDLGIRGKAYVLVGGSSGIGWETVRLLCAEGAHVAIISRSPERLKDAIASLERKPETRVLALSGDVSRPGSVESALAQAISALGVIRGLAITNHFMGKDGRFAAMGDLEWDRYYQNSLMGAVRACRTIVPHMAGEGGGTIVLTSAYSSRAPKPTIVAYGAFKAALNNLGKSLAKTYGSDGIRVNVVAPGAIKTGRYDARMMTLVSAEPAMSSPEAETLLLQRMDMKVALGRIGEAHEVADMIAFLLSERAAYTTGLVANIDGGTDF